MLFFFSPAFNSNGIHAASDFGLCALKGLVAVDEAVGVLNHLIAELDPHALFGNGAKQGLDPRLHFIHGGVVAEVRQRAAEMEARDIAAVGSDHDSIG